MEVARQAKSYKWLIARSSSHHCNYNYEQYAYGDANAYVHFLLLELLGLFFGHFAILQPGEKLHALLIIVCKTRT